MCICKPVQGIINSHLENWEGAQEEKTQRSQKEPSGSRIRPISTLPSAPGLVLPGPPLQACAYTLVPGLRPFHFRYYYAVHILAVPFPPCPCKWAKSYLYYAQGLRYIMNTWVFRMDGHDGKGYPLGARRRKGKRAQFKEVPWKEKERHIVINVPCHNHNHLLSSQLLLPLQSFLATWPCVFYYYYSCCCCCCCYYSSLFNYLPSMHVHVVRSAGWYLIFVSLPPTPAAVE